MRVGGSTNRAWVPVTLLRCSGMLVYAIQNPSTIAGSKAVRRTIDGASLLDSSEHAWRRRCVVTSHWVVPLRPDIWLAAGELARYLVVPTIETRYQLNQLAR